MKDINRFTRAIVRRNGEYLVGRILYSKDLRWSRNIYDAWQTRNVEEAEAWARKTGGITMLFNPVSGKSRIY